MPGVWQVGIIAHSMTAKVSLVVPIYNTAGYLKKALTALTGQSYQNIEIICVDDGSTDGSLELVRAYASSDQRIKLLAQKHRGPASARNLGLDRATGKYLTFVDSDDWCEKTYVEKLLRGMEKEKADVVMGDFEVTYENGVKRPDFFMPKPFENRGRLSVQDNFYELVSNVILWGKLFKKSLVDKYGIRFPDGREHDDAAFVIQYLSVAKIYANVPEKLYNYVVRADSVMDKAYTKHDFEGRQFDLLHVATFIYDFMERNQLLERYGVFVKGFAHLAFMCVVKGYSITEADIPVACKLYHQLTRRWSVGDGATAETDD